MFYMIVIIYEKEGQIYLLIKIISFQKKKVLRGYPNPISDSLFSIHLKKFV